MAPYYADNADQILDALYTDNNDSGVNVGQMMCIGSERVRERVGEAKWRQIKERVGDLIMKATQEYCSSKDRFFRCKDCSVLIVFHERNGIMTQAVASSIAKKVNSALFGSSDFEGLSIKSVVSKADGLELSESTTPEEIISALRRKAGVKTVGETPEASQTSAKQPYLSIVNDEAKPHAKEKPKLRLPSSRDELMSKLQSFEERPIEFRFIPVWDVQKCFVRMFNVVAVRPSAMSGRALWNYSVLGGEPDVSEIVELDVAALERGLLQTTDHLLKGDHVDLVPNLHFETLASRKGRDDLFNLLSCVPPQVRKHVYPNVMHIPDGLPEGRMVELTNQLRALTPDIGATVTYSKRPSESLAAVNRMRMGGFGWIFIRLSRDPENAELDWAKQATARVKQLGGVAGVMGIGDRENLMDLAYGGLDFCSGPIVGGPYDSIPAPFAYNGKSLEENIIAR